MKIAKRGKRAAGPSRRRIEDQPLHRGDSSALAADVEALLAAVPELLFFLDVEDRSPEDRDRAARPLGASARSVVGRSLEEALPEAAAVSIREAARRACQAGAPMAVEYVVPSPAGPRHFEARLVPLAAGRAAVLCTDVTSRKTAEEALHRREAQLRHLLALSPAVLYSLSGKPGAYEVSSASENITSVVGWTAEEVKSPEWWLAHLHPDDRASALAAPGQLGERGRIVHEYRFRHKNGEWRWIRDELVLVRGEAGEPSEVVGAFSDVTAAHEAEESLRELQERFRLGFENAPIGMALVSVDNRFLQVNGALCRILGHPSDRLVGMTVAEITHPDDVAAEATLKATLGKGDGSSYQMEKRYLHADGHVVWGRLSVSAVTGRDDKLLYYIGQLEDVTEQRRAEESLRQSEERFRALIEKATDMLAVVDGQGVLRFSSPAFTETLGWSPAELVGRNALEIVHPADVAEARRALDELGSSPGRVLRRTLRLRCKDGGWRITESSMRSSLNVPAVEGIIVNSRDVTEEKRLAEQFQQAQKLESVGRLAGGVAHDFNNLLTAILGYAELLERGIRRGWTDLDDLAEIRRAGERARELTRQLLAFARRQVIEPRVLDLNTAMRESEKLLSRVLGEDVELVLRLASGLWPVSADAAQMQQVILNLAVNARDAMPRGGRIVIETANVEVDEARAVAHPGMRPGPHVLLTVSDSGEGMSPAAKAHIFEPFYTTKPPGTGTGLGLATVYGIVKQSGGHIIVYSEQEKGTTLEIYLPRTDAKPAEATAPTLAAAPCGSETVLVVEDEPSVRELMARALSDAGYRVLLARHGAEALEVATRNPEAIHLLVTDVVMPGMSGEQLAGTLRRERPDLEVLYVSGYTLDTVVYQGVLEAGANLLEKPFTPSSLQRKVRDVLDGPS